MLSDDQARAVAMVEEIAPKRGYALKVVDVAKTNILSQFLDTHLKGVERFPVLIAPNSHRRLEGPEDFKEETLCAALPTELKITRAFSYIKVRTQDIDHVQKSLLAYPEVKETHLVTGDWDVLAILEFPPNPSASKRQVLDFIVEKVAKIPGVEDTSTLVPEYSVTKFPV
jgi:DNA-binding Lrp family transcriptional regulator